MIQLANIIEDINYINEGEILEVNKIGKNYSIPYICILRHLNVRDLLLLLPPIIPNDQIEFKKLKISQKPEGNFSRYNLYRTNKSFFKDWRYKFYDRIGII